jgi:hypothetical protein
MAKLRLKLGFPLFTILSHALPVLQLYLLRVQLGGCIVQIRLVLQQITTKIPYANFKCFQLL